MKQPQYVFRPNLDDPQQRQAWAILEQIPSGQRKAFLTRAILATEQDNSTLSGSVHCRGEAIILPGTELRNPTSDLFILNGDKVYLAPGENRQDVYPQQKPKAKDIER